MIQSNILIGHEYITKETMDCKIPPLKPSDQMMNAYNNLLIQPFPHNELIPPLDVQIKTIQNL